ncbi:MAG: hypothetical protein EPO20_13190 [Betaproteobacteria bacterium]|nr:MAG: hypothetical protein EPO20_13190 [Betaproteobacteria bacterium]
MIVLQIVPRAGTDAYKLLRDKVTHEARTWSWRNKAKTRLQHVQKRAGYIEVGSAEGVVVAQIVPAKESDQFFLAEKFIGRLIAWFADDLATINLQFLDVPRTKKKK